MKFQTGTIGFYKGVLAEVKTTRVFFTPKDSPSKIRGVELWLKDNPPKEEFLNRYNTFRPGNHYSETVVFVSIVDFRKNFVTTETAHLFYEKT